MTQRENGVVIGTVSDLKDPEKLGRVKLKLPQYNDQLTDWARLVSPMAGKDRGFFYQPEVGDEVLVVFENGDPRRAYVLGALWSKVDTPPERDGKDEENNWRFIKSRSGHLVKLDDTKGAEKIEIIDKSGNHKIVIDSANSKIEIVCTSGDMEIKAPAGKLEINAQTIEIKSSGQMTVQADAAMTIKGTTVNIN
jgi:phage baseplate assembly protein V